MIATHRRRSSPLHAARAGIGAVWCITVGLVALSFEHPLLLVTVLGSTLAAAALARVGPEVMRAMVWALPLAFAIALVNAVVTREGLTVVFRGPVMPGIGRLDITAEALAYGGVLALRATAIIACAALLAATVDPDELLRDVRRRSLRVGVTAALATHLVGVLARDGRRLAALDVGSAPRPHAPADQTAPTDDSFLSREVARALDRTSYRPPIVPPSESRDDSGRDHAVARHRGKHRGVQPRERPVPAPVPLPAARPARLHQREGAAVESRSHRHQLS